MRETIVYVQGKGGPTGAADAPVGQSQRRTECGKSEDAVWGGAVADGPDRAGNVAWRLGSGAALGGGKRWRRPGRGLSAGLSPSAASRGAGERRSPALGGSAGRTV